MGLLELRGARRCEELGDGRFGGVAGRGEWDCGQWNGGVERAVGHRVGGVNSFLVDEHEVGLIRFGGRFSYAV